MAKKAAKVAKFDDDASNYLFNKYGDIIKSGADVLTQIQDLKTLSFSPALDMALGGGLREGTVVGIAGPPKTGKTTAVLHFAAKCQKLGKLVVYLNTEGRLNSQNFEGVKDLDVEALKIVESTDKEAVSGEMFLEIAEYYGKNVPGCIILIDSLSSLVPKAELEGDLNAQTRNSLPRLLSQFFKRAGHYVAKNGTILICIAHQIADTGPSRQTKMTDCGNMFQYQVGTNLVITHRSRWKGKAEGDPDPGQVINWEIKTSNTGGTPGTTVEGWLRYGIGIDEVQELMQAGCECRLIKDAGSWYTISALVEDTENELVAKYLKDNGIGDKPEDIERAFKFQGAAKMHTFFTENPQFVELLLSKMTELYV